MTKDLLIRQSNGLQTELANGSTGATLRIDSNGNLIWSTIPIDSQTAITVEFTPYGAIGSTSVQEALQEIVDEFCHNPLTLDAVTNPALTLTGQMVKLDLSVIPDANAAVCEVPARLAASNNKAYGLASILATPTFQEVTPADYYAAGNSVPGSAVNQGVITGAISVTNPYCRPALVWFTWQGWAFMNFLAQNDGCSYSVYYSLNGAAYTMDHAIGLRLTGDPTIAGNGIDAKSYLERYTVVAPGDTVTFAVRVDFLRTLAAGLANAGFQDTGYANSRLTATLFCGGDSQDYINVVFDGNSLTEGTTASPYPDQVVSLLSEQYAYANIAVGGQNTDDMLTRQASQLYARYNGAARKNMVVAWEGTNQLGHDNCNAALSYQRMVTYCQNARANGWTVIVGTVLPQNVFNTNCFETARQTYNSLLRANWASLADALADIAASPLIGYAGAWADITYYQADQIHLNDNGNGVVADIVAPIINSL